MGDHAMAQTLQANPSVISIGASIGASKLMNATPIASIGQLPVRSRALSVKNLEAELQEHRYYLERKVEERTEQLVKCIKLLESCNTNLCDKLAQAKREIAALHNQLANVQSGAAYD